VNVGPRPASDGARPRILLSAFTADPTAGSESKVGWMRAEQASQYLDTWLICAPHVSQSGIEEYLAERSTGPGFEIVYVEMPRWIEMLEHVPGLYYLAYNLWQRRAFRVAEALHEDVGFDLVHHVNLGGFREPGYLWRLGPPYVWGPIGGTQNYPVRFLVHAGIVGGAREAIRSVLNRLTLRWSRRVRQAARHAAEMRAANTTVARDFERELGCPSVEVMLETGAPPVGDGREVERVQGPIRIMWAGELKAFKALPMLLDALRLLPAGLPFELTVVGDGPERRRWQRRARRLGVDDRISWTGWIDHRDMVHLYEASDLFVFTSLRDTSGNVVLEALARGVPVVAPAHQGVGDILSEECGVLIPVTNHWDMVKAYRDAIANLAGDPATRAQLREGARDRADFYSWIRQGDRMKALYASVLGARLSDTLN